MFDGNGNWTSDFSAISDRDNDIKILASRFDNILLADIKESFENCLTKDGQIAPIGAFNMGGQKITNLANGTNPNDAVNMSQIESQISTMLSTLYPVGSIYIGTQSTCPMANLIAGSTWTLVSSGKALWTGDGTNANTTIAAGLPNISGTVTNAEYVSATSGTGCFTTSNGGGNGAGGSGDRHKNFTITMNASNSSSIYGNSSTVQPPAYVVNVWRRSE